MCHPKEIQDKIRPNAGDPSGGYKGTQDNMGTHVGLS